MATETQKSNLLNSQRYLNIVRVGPVDRSESKSTPSSELSLISGGSECGWRSVVLEESRRRSVENGGGRGKSVEVGCGRGKSVEVGGGWLWLGEVSGSRLVVVGGG